jgi:dipeptidyl aminopeptidase/acylaminoacyl peptidase
MSRSFLAACLVCSVAVLPFTFRDASASDEQPGVRQIGELVLDGIPEIPDRIIERTNQYQNVRSAAFQDWAPQGGLLLATRFGETTQLHHVAAKGAARRQLTFFHEPVSGGSFGKSKEWFLFNRDAGGDEASQIFRFDLTSGKATLLSDGERQNGLPLWSNARDRVAWRSTARNGKDHDIWVMDPQHPEKRRIAFETEGYWYPTDWSPDDKRLVVANYVSITESYFWVVDVETGEKQPIGNHKKVKGETISYGSAVFDHTGEGVFFTSDERTEHRTLRYLKLGSKKYEEITTDIPWGVKGLRMSPNRGRLGFLVNDDGRDQLYVMNTANREYSMIPLKLGIIAGYDFDPEGQRIAFTFESPAGPDDVYVVDLNTGDIDQWTHSEVGGLDTSKFRMSEIIHFPTFDKGEDGNPRMIPAFLYKPAGKGPFPVIVRIHGGPESQARAWFSYTSQYELGELGCAVIYPNVRGSAGYGKTYLKLDNGFKREDSVKDIGALLDWIATQPDLDETKVGVTGGSYGGYMVLATLTNYPDRVRAGIEAVGISNFVTFLTNTADYRRDLRRAEYGDERDKKMYTHLQEISPTNNVAKIDVPLFVVQGANDPRVPASEAAQIVEAVRSNGKHAWYMLALDEGHGFRKKRNNEQRAYASSLFWETYLLDRAPTLKVEKPEEVPGASH